MVTGVDPDELVLFAFDDHWIPLCSNLALQLEQPTLYPGNPVLERGTADEPDSFFASLYGTVFRLDGKFRMWYGAVDSWQGFHPGRSNMRLAYAESEDGIHWIKPKLGLQAYRGSTSNNLLAIDREVYNSPLVLYDPQEADPQRRFKMTFVGYHHQGLPLKPLLCVAFSPDGLRWTSYAGNPVVRNIWAETSGLYRWDGIYYCNGQSTWPASNPKRTMVSFASGDFQHWEQAAAVNFYRHGLEKSGNENEGSQVHLGASIWHRRSVLLGLYGKWENPTGRKATETRIDLGLIISNDGLVFREPVPDFRFIGWGRETSNWKTLRLLQAQAFVNHADKTYIWYGAGSDDTGRGVAVENQAEVGLATLPRDRFARCVPRDPQQPGPARLCQPCPPGQKSPSTRAAWATGRCWESNCWTINSGRCPVTAATAAAWWRESGLHQTVAWNGGRTAVPIAGPCAYGYTSTVRKPATFAFSVCMHAPAQGDRPSVAAGS